MKYYSGDGTILRDTKPDFFRLEIYRGNGKWEPYPTTQLFFTTRHQLTAEQVREAIAAFDGESEAGTSATPDQSEQIRLTDLVKRLPADVNKAVEMLAKFKFAEQAERVEGYYEKESEGWSSDSLEELQILDMAGMVPAGVFSAFAKTFAETAA